MYTFSPMMVASSRKHHCRVRLSTREFLVISTNLDIQKNHYPLDFTNRRGDEARIKNTWYNQGYCRDHLEIDSEFNGRKTLEMADTQSEKSFLVKVFQTHLSTPKSKKTAKEISGIMWEMIMQGSVGLFKQRKEDLFDEYDAFVPLETMVSKAVSTHQQPARTSSNSKTHAYGAVYGQIVTEPIQREGSRATNSQVNEVHSNNNAICDNVHDQLSQEMHQDEHLDSDAETEIDGNTIPFHSVVPLVRIAFAKILDPKCDSDREHTKVLELEAEISKQKQLITESEKRFAFLEQNYVNLQLKFQNYKQCIDTSSASNAIFEINKLRQQLQGKDDTIRNLDAQINIMKVLNVGSTASSCDQQVQLKDTITSLRIQLDGLKVENVSLKRQNDELSQTNTHSHTAYTEKLSALTAGNSQLKAQSQRALMQCSLRRTDNGTEVCGRIRHRTDGLRVWERNLIYNTSECLDLCAILPRLRDVVKLKAKADDRIVPIPSGCSCTPVKFPCCLPDPRCHWFTFPTLSQKALLQFTKGLLLIKVPLPDTSDSDVETLFRHVGSHVFDTMDARKPFQYASFQLLSISMLPSNNQLPHVQNGSSTSLENIYGDKDRPSLPGTQLKPSQCGCFFQ
ncbi:hypothetical protein Tco_0368524 [Tanacetum coccineum]